MKKFIVFIFALTALGCFLACAPKHQAVIKKADLDLSVKPGENFFRYANGPWLDKTTIPDDKTSYTTFDVLREKKDHDINILLEEVKLQKDAQQGSVAQKIRDFYLTGMDKEKIETEGLSAIQPELESIENIKSMDDFQNLVAEFHKSGIGTLFGGSVFQDLKNNEEYRFYFAQSGLGLPDVEYYSKTDDRSVEIRTEYVKHISKMFQLMGEEEAEAQKHAEIVMNIENSLAGSSRTRLQMRNIPALYNLKTMDELQTMCPNFNFKRYMASFSDKDFGDVVVMVPEFFENVNKMLTTVPIDQWKIYLKWNLINESANYLSSNFVNQDYAFYSEFLSGSKTIKERWKRVTTTLNGYLGEPLGQLYVKKHFPETSKTRMVQLVKNLKATLKNRLEKLEWMGPETKKEALVKLAEMKVKIGYPDKWIDFSSMKIENDSYIKNVRRANRFHIMREINKFGKPVDKEEWGMTPQTVNAGYNPILNDITFPAGILQPPYFDPNADDAVNYGAIGVVIGHEMTHGFDDQGRRFDANGNMTDWWTEKDAEEFTKRTQILIDQYDKFVAIGDVHINGKLTLGENIADFGGLTISMEAYESTLNENEKAPVIDGFTDIQRFYLSYAKLWRGKIRDKALIRKCQEDVHPWGKFRVNGALFNKDKFYEAFQISETDPLYVAPENRPVIW